jgi:predicted phosphoadenosine phosphosulfate sulfurtransferase
MELKRYLETNVLTEAVKRIEHTFDNFERIYISFSAGKDSTVMLHLVMAEAIKRNRKVGILLVDLEAQYRRTMQHAFKCFEMYKDHIDLHWVCLPIHLRNAVSNFQPQWLCWDPENKDNWVRDMPDYPGVISDETFFPFFQRGMEFEEFVPEFAEWYAQGKSCACFIGIRTDESLNRFRTIAVFDKKTFDGKRYTTKVSENTYNIYPIYDWAVSDIWLYHYKNPFLPYNEIYDYMYRAGLTPSQMRICQPYGDDQRRGLWLYHLLEPETWYKVVSRVNGVNSGSLYIQETGNITGYNKISKPEGHTWKSYCNLLLSMLPKKTQDHYIAKFRGFISGWKSRGYNHGIPDEAPVVLENKHWAPSWRRLCKVLLRNDYWCKGLGLTQPKSEAYGKYLKIRDARKAQGLEVASEETESA